MMRSSVRGLLAGAFAVGVLGAASGALAGDTAAEMGKKSYMKHCATCHGPSGTGDGVAANTFNRKPVDLTLLAKNNGGKFPTMMVINIVKGDTSVPAHGTREMPVWGEIVGHPLKGDMYGKDEAEAKILEIANYLQSIQKK